MRIGVVLSILWVVGASGTVWMQETDRNQRYWRGLADERSNCIGQNAARRMQRLDDLPCTTQEQLDKALHTSIPLWLPLSFAGFYLVLGWVLTGIAYVSIRWIKAGFARP
jgi:hypothetical protein